MASRKTVTRTIIDESPDETETPGVVVDSDDNPENDPTLRDFINKLGPGSITFRVFRATTKGNEFAFAGEDEFDEEMLQDMFPQGGKFIIRVYRNGKWVAPSHSIRVGPKPYVNGQVNSGGNGNGNTSNDRMWELQLQLLRDQNQRQHEMILAMINKNQESSGGSLKDMVETLVAMKQLQPDTNLDTLMKGIELAKDISGGDGDWKTEVLKIAKDVGPALLMSRTPTPTQQQPQPALNPAPNANVTVQPNANPNTNENAEMQTQIRMGLAMLKRKCDQKVPPEFFIDQAVFFADNEMVQRLVSTMCESESFDAFVGVIGDPSIGQPPYREWMQTIYDGIREEFLDSGSESGSEPESETGTGHEQPNTLDTDPGGTIGNGNHPADDGGAIEAGNKAS